MIENARHLYALTVVTEIASLIAHKQWKELKQNKFSEWKLGLSDTMSVSKKSKYWFYLGMI